MGYYKKTNQQALKQNKKTKPLSFGKLSFGKVEKKIDFLEKTFEKLTKPGSKSLEGLACLPLESLWSFRKKRSLPLALEGKKNTVSFRFALGK